LGRWITLSLALPTEETVPAGALASPESEAYKPDSQQHESRDPQQMNSKPKTGYYDHD
jgi:hypothetical protein